jgi:thymidylate synthase (FAD)
MRVELIAITPDAERVIEQAGRTCYQSSARIGPNSEKDFIPKVMENGHHSVLEHACAAFRVTEVSRSFTHQLVRHRLCAFSQRSQRYVDEKSFAFVEPKSVRQKPEAHRLFGEFMAGAKDTYRELQKLGVNNEHARFVLPNAVESEIVISANFRQLRHIFCVRCDRHAHPRHGMTA